MWLDVGEPRLCLAPAASMRKENAVNHQLKHQLGCGALCFAFAVIRRVSLPIIHPSRYFRHQPFLVLPPCEAAPCFGVRLANNFENFSSFALRLSHIAGNGGIPVFFDSIHSA